MATGICKLCLLEKDLQQSHFVGAGLYRIADKRGGAVVKTQKLFLGTDKQIRDYVLCRECEQLFNKKGEDYVMRLVKQDSGNFPLLELLSKHKPIATGPNSGDRFSGAEIGLDMEKIAYYGLSMFWRAAVHTWPIRVQGQVTGGGKLSADDLEGMRKYLQGESGWPSGIVLQVIVCTDLISQDNVQVPTDWENDVYMGSSMVAYGIFFMLIVGVKPDAPEWSLHCLTSPQCWIFRHSCDETTRMLENDLRSNAKIADNLKQKKE